MKTQVIAPVGTAIVLVAFLLSGCNKPADGGTGGAAGTSGQSAAPASTETASAAGSTTPAAETAPAEPPPGEAFGVGDTPAGKGTQSGKVTQVDLTGRWLALFGRTETKGIDEAWQRGEVLEFEQGGGLVWTHNAGEAPVKYSTTLDGNTLRLTPGSKLNVGRDDEVGLMNVGRDDEVGLDKSKPAKAPEASPANLNPRIFRDGNYLALVGAKNTITVYGKVDDKAPEQAPAISGPFRGSIESSENLPAQFKWDGKQLVADIDRGKLQFKGTYVKGYFVGIEGQALAALARKADGTLDGILLPSPYNTMNATFDFHPGE